jgi:hypothetical protein
MLQGQPGVFSGAAFATIAAVTDFLNEPIDAICQNAGSQSRRNYHRREPGDFKLFSVK